jgi:hypothetical protein
MVFNRVFVVTSSAVKLAETQAHMRLYGLECVAHPPFAEGADLEASMTALVEGDPSALAALREESVLLAGDRKRGRAQMVHLERVWHSSSLLAVYRGKAAAPGGAAVVVKRYVHETEGYLDLTRDGGELLPVFGWDATFVLGLLGRTFHDYRRDGHKCSPRDRVLAMFIQDRLYYSALVDAKHRPLRPTRPVDFERDPGEHILTHFKEIKGPACTAHRIVPGLVVRVLNSGFFHRSAENRREKAYWWPGLNAGIPLVEKPNDPIQELVYAVHDLGHFLIPDLIFTGRDEDLSPLGKFVYTAFRLMSEATTITLADMLTVSAMLRDGVPYATVDKRKIHPLFVTAVGARGLLPDDPGYLARLRELLFASMQFCLTGQTDRLRALVEASAERDGLAKPNLEPLETFADKFSAFFLDDARWSIENYANMAANAAEFRRWWAEAAEPIRQAEPEALGLPTVGEYIRSFKGRSPEDLEALRVSDPELLLDVVYGRLLDELILPVFDPAARDLPLAPFPERASRAFRRWAMGQAFVFTSLGHVPEAATFQRLFVAQVKRPAALTAAEMRTTRAFLEAFLDQAVKVDLLDPDDCATFKEVFPLFPPFFVNYDLYASPPHAQLRDLCKKQGFVL